VPIGLRSLLPKTAAVDLAENAEVLAYLHVEQLPEWRDSDSVWIVDGYALTTHPDLCERVDEINAAAAGVATRRYLYGKPALLAPNGVIVAFANGTHTFCIRLPRDECDENLLNRHEYPASRFPTLREKQRQLDALTARTWTRLDPYAVAVPKADGLERLGAHVARAVATATSHSSE